MKACDNIPIVKLWHVLNEMDINLNIIRAFQELKKTKTKIKQAKIFQKAL